MPPRKFHRSLCVVLLLAAAGCASLDRSSDPASQYSAWQLHDMGQKFLAAGDLGQALKFLTLAEKKSPKDPAIQYHLGLAYGSRGLPVDAQAHFEKALALKPDYPEVNNALGAFYAERGQLDKAEENFQKALANPLYQTPSFPLYNLGRLYEKKGDLDAALKYYQEAVRLQWNYGAAHFRTGQILEAKERNAEAREAYGKAIEYAPDLAEAHLRFGVLSYSVGEIESAMYSFSRVIKLAPRSNMAVEAKKYLERLQTVVPSPLSSSDIAASERLSQMEVMSDKEKFTTARLPLDAPRAAENAKSASASQKWMYIVQVASFLDSENAEILRKKLIYRGYEVSVKNFSHQVLGPIYIIQIKPESDLAKANSMLAEIENSEKVKPIILKVPADH